MVHSDADFESRSALNFELCAGFDRYRILVRDLQRQLRVNFDTSDNVQCEHCINVKLGRMEDPRLFNLGVF
jgi:hypothetical protein